MISCLDCAQLLLGLPQGLRPKHHTEKPAGSSVPGPFPALAQLQGPSLAQPPGTDLRPWPCSGSFWSREKMGGWQAVGWLCPVLGMSWG